MTTTEDFQGPSDLMDQYSAVLRGLAEPLGIAMAADAIEERINAALLPRRVPNIRIDRHNPSLFIEIIDCVATADVAAVTVVVQVGGQTWEVEGSAKRGPEDKTDRDLGVLLATARALEKIAHQFGRQAEGRVRHNDDMRAQRKQQFAQRIEAKATRQPPKTVHRSTRSAQAKEADDS